MPDVVPGWAWLFGLAVFSILGCLLYAILTSSDNNDGFGGGSFGGGFSGGGGATGSKNIDTFFDDSDRRRIREAVTEAETHTSAEIVPVLTESSGRYDRAEDLAGCVLSIGLLSLCWLKFQHVLIDGSWQTQRDRLRIA